MYRTCMAIQRLVSLVGKGSGKLLTCSVTWVRMLWLDSLAIDMQAYKRMPLRSCSLQAEAHYKEL